GPELPRCADESCSLVLHPCAGAAAACGRRGARAQLVARPVRLQPSQGAGGQGGALREVESGWQPAAGAVAALLGATDCGSAEGGGRWPIPRAGTGRAGPGQLERAAAEGKRLVASVAGTQMPVTPGHWPAHIYNFDFSGLNATLPHLKNPRGNF